MKAQHLGEKYRITVVLDSTKSSKIAVKNAVNLAKRIKGSIDLLKILSPDKVVKSDNQLSAMRELNEATLKANKNLVELAESIMEDYKIPTTYNISYGNTIDSVEQHISNSKPDIIVVSKRKWSVLNLWRADLSAFLIKNYNGALLISDENTTIDDQSIINLGFLDEYSEEKSNSLFVDLKKNASPAVSVFRASNSTFNINNDIKYTVVNDDQSVKDLRAYDFESGTNSDTSISKYIEKSGVNLLCVYKDKVSQLGKKSTGISKQMYQVVQKTNRPVLILGE